MSAIPVIVGPTGSGKTGVSVKIAKEVRGQLGLDCEIISADSRTIYKDFNIGTAKPSEEEREGVVHHGFDLVEANERFTVKDWKDYVEGKIEEIQNRGGVPIVVGGTGLYIDALVFDYKFEAPSKGYEGSRGKCIKNLNGKNGSVIQNDKKRYPDRQELCSEYKIFGIKGEKEGLRQRIFERADKMFNSDLYKETETLVKKYGWDNQAMTGDIYKYAWMFLNNELSREEAVRLTAFNDWHLAKRQLTWFKRNDKICWLPLEKIKPAVIKCIQDEQRK